MVEKVQRFGEIPKMVRFMGKHFIKRLLTFFSKDILSGKSFKGDFLQRQIYGKKF